MPTSHYLSKKKLYGFIDLQFKFRIIRFGPSRTPIATQSIGGSKEGGMRDVSLSPISFVFMQFWGKIWPNNR